MSKKIASILVLGLVVSFVLSSGWCAVEESVTYRNQEKGFSIEFPGDWEQIEGYMGTTILALSPLENAQDRFRENVNVIVNTLPEEISLDEHFQQNLAAIGEALGDYQELGKGSTTIDKTDTRWLAYSHRMEGYQLKALVYIMIKNGREYVITFSANSDDFSRYLNKFETIAHSLRFI